MLVAEGVPEVPEDPELVLRGWALLIVCGTVFPDFPATYARSFIMFVAPVVAMFPCDTIAFALAWAAVVFPVLIAFAEPTVAFPKAFAEP